MLKIFTQTTNEFHFNEKTEKKIRDYAKKHNVDLKNAVYDLMDEDKFDMSENIYKETVNYEILTVNI